MICPHGLHSRFAIRSPSWGLNGRGLKKGCRMCGGVGWHGSVQVYSVGVSGLETWGFGVMV